MNIVYTTDARFLPQVAASITSVCENNQKAPVIRFFVLTLGVAAEDQEKLAGYVQGTYARTAIRSVTCIDLQNIEQYFDFSFDTSGWNSIVLARLVLDRILPPDLHRVLYLDGDTIVRRSLKSLWKTDMGKCPVGAAMEPTCSRERKKALGLSGQPYYNAGVLLIDLDNWREQKTGQALAAYYKEHGGRLFANDQDVINGCLRGKICPLSPAYNYHNTYDLYRYRLLQKNCDHPVPSRQEMQKIRKNPCIVHFLGEERPWREGNTHRFRDEYLACLEMTPWRGQGMEKGWRTYFFCWRVFNFVMKPFPMLRLSVINHLIPYMLKRRS